MLRFALIQVIDPHLDHNRDSENSLSNMTELEMLVDTFGGQVVQKLIQHKPHPHPSTYIWPGKVEELKILVKKHNIDVVVVNDVAKSSQLFRLEKALWEVNTRIAVWDRIDLILGIFEKHATSNEAKLQIELARINHRGSRIYGLGGTVLSRQGAGIGTKGLGETNSELERRLIKKRTQEIKKKIAHVSQTKERRLLFRDEQGIGPVALVGYTSAGKTTLFNRLTGKGKETNKGLFTTLDTVVGKLKVAESPQPILISDTIGFIQDLPHELIDAFRSTLMESVQAKLLLHVVDASDPHRETKIEVVEKILDELKVTQPIITVFNKVDALDEEAFEELQEKYVGHNAEFISAQTGIGMEELKKEIVKKLPE